MTEKGGRELPCLHENKFHWWHFKVRLTCSLTTRKLLLIESLVRSMSPATPDSCHHTESSPTHGAQRG